MIIDASKARYPNNKTMDVQLPYSNSISTTEFFQFIGAQLGLDQVQDKLSFEFAFNDLLRQTGSRANLINLVCEHVVDQLTHQTKAIDLALIQQALQSHTLYDAMQGWSNLTQDTMASALDRSVVYLTFIHGSIDLSTVLRYLQQAQVQIDAEQLKQSLHRLPLAHILYKHDGQYVFAVPLFAQQHNPDEAKMLLQQELRSLHG